MARESIAVKYRPQSLADVSEQKSVTKVLEKQVQQGQLKNCYLFAGPSGCGKTTIARCFAKLINEGYGQPEELDAASENGVDNIRVIIDQANERAIEGKYKIFIIDECHMITTAGWNAFLKTLEEPPLYTIFMFCTTDPQKIPTTVLNRLMRFNLTKLSFNAIMERLEYVCRFESFIYEQEALEYIAKLSNGCMRQALADLEKVSDLGSINVTNALECLGTFSYDLCFKITNAIIDGDETELLRCISELYDSGYDLKYFIDYFLSFVLDLGKYTIFNNLNLIKIPPMYEEQIKYVVGIENAKSYYMYLVDKILDLKVLLKNETKIKDVIEIWFLKLARGV
jgi:DNA polymerase-3 subunit gamma/tau